VTTSAERTAGDFATDLAALRQDVARLAETMSELLRHQTQAAGHRVFEAVGDARDKLSGTAADAQNRTGAARDALEAKVSRHPLTVTLVAFGVGVSLGLLSRRRD
jgi:ElaB/YqjD/DUF883 family membrane-anchored ribosome-binding protein